jgi:hypothetical protein
LPLGEDLPMLVPISIVITIFVVFLLTLFVNMANQTEIVKMSQVAIDTSEYIANIKFAGTLGNLDYKRINSTGKESTCKDLNNLNISVNYQMKINVSDISKSKWWCWDNVNSYSKEPTDVVNFMLPILIENQNLTDLGKVTVVVSK